MALLVFIVFFMSLAGHSCGLYCVCKDGVGDQTLQKAIDYACGAGADCAPILQNGPCFQPNTIKDHCNYAVNSYFQRKGQAQGSCDFAGAAAPSLNQPSSATSTCVYPSSPSNLGTGTTTTPTTSTPGTSPSTVTPTTPTTGTTPTGTTPTGTTTGTGTGTGTTTGMVPATSTGSPNVFGISPTSSSTGSGGFNDSSDATMLQFKGTNNKIILLTLVIALWLAFRA